ncbi:recombinase family protein [Hymenobacter sp. ISL-91]|uniref:recombinase family protein n=1 Tax=Hymenobacter sp. ISL-91 TaxID=2819151 RepID=UPI001BEBC382|nr:recombinase family protein [Hymenobacter sp. ISL-91]MBT2559316.1 recombinase family protein [Hymenobacter sp. ISL-91]
MNFGYARVSAKDQHLDTQLAQLQAAGVDRVFEEKISGATIQRPMLTEMLSRLRTGDTVTVARLNRLGRNSAHIMQLVAELHERQVRFVALDLGIDTATPAGRLVLGIFAALAEYDRESIRERATAGIALAKAQGKHLGRRPGVDAGKLAKVQACLTAGMSVHQTVAATGVSESSVKRYRRQVELRSSDAQ